MFKLKIHEEKYTVLTYNIGHYDWVHPIIEKSPRATYILITDDPDFKDESGTWDIVYDSGLTGSAFDKCYQIRFNPFKYTTDKIIIRIDGSMEVRKNLDPIVDKFIEGKYEMALIPHPDRDRLLPEYRAWRKYRGYSHMQIKKVVNFLKNTAGYDIEHYKGMAQFGFVIQINDKINRDVDRLTYAFLKLLGTKKTDIERIDQTMFSFALQKYFPEIKIMWIDHSIIYSDFIEIYCHEDKQKLSTIAVITQKITKPYFYNKKINEIFYPNDFK